MHFSRQRLEKLIARHFDGSLDGREEKELAQLLDRHEEARALFAAYMRLEGATLQLANASCISNPPEDAVPAAQPSVRRRSSSGAFRMRRALAAGVLIAVSLVVFFGSREVVQPDPVFATISRIINASWDDTGMPREVDADLTAGSIALKSGLVQIDFMSGATVVLEGPVEFDVISAMRGCCRSGKLRVHVPEKAQGFTIDTLETIIVDLGTEFGLHIDETGNTEVHVFDGAVELHDVSFVLDSDGKKMVHAGSAVQIEAASGKHKAVPAKNESFVGPSMLVNLSAVLDRDLKKRLKLLQADHAGLSRRIQDYMKNEIHGKRLAELKRGVDHAMMVLEAHVKSNTSLQKAQAMYREKQLDLDRLCREKLASNEVSSKVLEGQKRLNAGLEALKKKKAALKGPSRKKMFRELDREIALVLKKRREAGNRLRSFKNRLIKRDPDLKAMRRKVNVAKKEYDKIAAVEFNGLKKALKNAQQAYQGEKKKILTADATLTALHAERAILSLRIQDLKAKSSELKNNRKR